MQSPAEWNFIKQSALYAFSLKIFHTDAFENQTNAMRIWSGDGLEIAINFIWFDGSGEPILAASGLGISAYPDSLIPCQKRVYLDFWPDIPGKSKTWELLEREEMHIAT